MYNSRIMAAVVYVPKARPYVFVRSMAAVVYVPKARPYVFVRSMAAVVYVPKARPYICALASFHRASISARVSSEMARP